MQRQICEWLKSLFAPSNNPIRATSYASTQPDTPTPKPLGDADYEYLFMQLLEGVTHGWQQQRVKRFFETLGERGNPELWIAWLRRFGERSLASGAANSELAARMVQLGQLGVGEIGDTAYEIGMQLLSRMQGEPVWEYEGPDVDFTTANNEEGEIDTRPSAPEMETLTLDELLVRLQEDPSLVEQIASQLQIETTDPQVIIQALVNQASENGESSTGDAEAWFNQGYKQVMAGDLLGAIASWDKSLEIKPDLHPAQFNRGIALGNLGRYEESIASFDKVLANKPDDYAAWLNRGNALLNSGRYEEAIASYDKVLEFKPDLYDAWNNRGNALLNLKRFEEAKACFDNAAQLNPESLRAE